MSRQKAYCNAAIQTCLTFKVLVGLGLRQTTGFVESLLKHAGLDWSVPDFSTLCRGQRTLSVAIRYKTSAGRLHLLVDSTGINAEGEDEWSARKRRRISLLQRMTAKRAALAAFEVGVECPRRAVSVTRHEPPMLKPF